jgi:heme/copper-type cytochrome/quinol oxidase subunit 4
MNASPWRIALDAYRTLAGHLRAAVMTSAAPLGFILAGMALASWAAIGEPFPRPSEVPESSHWDYLSIVLYAAIQAVATLVLFVPWLRYLMGMRGASWIWLGSPALRAAPVWLLSWLVGTLIVALGALFFLLPLALVMFFAVMGEERAEGFAEPTVWIVYPVIFVAWAGSIFVTANLILRAALISLGLPWRSELSDRVVRSWVPAAKAIIVATTPLLILDIVAVSVFQGLDLNVDWVEAPIPILSTLLEGVICVAIIHRASAPQPE